MRTHTNTRRISKGIAAFAALTLVAAACGDDANDAASTASSTASSVADQMDQTADTTMDSMEETMDTTMDSMGTDTTMTDSMAMDSPRLRHGCDRRHGRGR
ncbi:MAG: hypothetical protein R2705_17825 [Ilumatobacteraceae bacterium]